ncbi:MAG: efflux RND transporter permease subunit [Burkholderiales bacterium]
MKPFNMSEWALSHRPFVLFVMIMLGVIGTFSYGRLGQSEDPPFTFKVMVVRTLWTGASAQEMELQITQKLEKKLQEVPYVDVLRSYSKPGESQIIIVLKDSTPAGEVPNAWYQARKKIGDVRNTLPNGINGPFFNDEFGDTLGNLFTLTGDGYSYALLKSYADTVRLELLRVPDVAKVDIIGDQDEKIFVELSNTKLATLGLDPTLIFTTLQTQNAIAAAGSYDTASDKIFLRVSGDFEAAENVRNIYIRSGNRSFRLGDIARVYRGYVDPPQPKVRFMGKEAVELGVAMTQGGDIIQLGKNLDRELKRIQNSLPIGLDLQLISSQPRAVSRSINEFVQTLAEAVIIVLVVSFFSLGIRTGIVVALSIPLVLAATFFFMHVFNIGLHKISLGALVLALGLLVDDAIIAVEMMAIKMEQGYDRIKAASFAYTSTAFPMLTGTLVTAAGFLPIATAQSATGEYTRAIFQVTVIALLTSWFAAVVFIPYLGFKLLPDFKNKNIGRARMLERLAGWLRAVNLKGIAAKLSQRADHLAAEPPQHDEHAVYHTPFYTRFRKVVEWCVNFRKTVLFLTAGIFAAAIVGFGLVQQQFFPDSTRPELLVDLRLPEGSSFAASEAEAKKLENIIAGDPNIENYVSYVGTGSPRFYLPLDQQLPANNFAQFVILAKGTAQREVLRNNLIKLFESDFAGLRGNINRLENGPPVGFPVQFRVTGPEIPVVQKYAAEVAAVMRNNKHLTNVQLDWNEQSKSINIEIDQEKARLLGVSSQDLSFLLNNSLNGFNVTSLRERDKLIEVLVRGAPEERVYLSQIENLSIPTRVGRSVPLAQFAKVTFGFERGIVWRRNLYPSVTARGSIYGTIQAPVVTGQIEPLLEPIRAKLPEGYMLETGGAVEESAKGGKSIVAGIPLFVSVVLTVLMLQLHSFSRMFMVLLTAPLGIIGVTLALLIGNKPFGFVAMLGTIALSGMIMRNSVILVDQIEHDIGMGHPPWDAIIDATVRRFRPIVLTAAAAILAMIPLSRSAFFGPMATAIMGGLFVATLLTLLFLPALYAAWFRVMRPQA